MCEYQVTKLLFLVISNTKPTGLQCFVYHSGEHVNYAYITNCVNNCDCHLTVTLERAVALA